MGTADDNREQPGLDEVADESAYEGRRPVGRSSVDHGAMTPIGHGGTAPPSAHDDADAKGRRRDVGGKPD